MAIKEVEIRVRSDDKQLKKTQKLVEAVTKKLGALDRVRIDVDTSKATRSLENLNVALERGEVLIEKFRGDTNAIKSGIGAFSNVIGQLKGEIRDLTVAFEATSGALDKPEKQIEQTQRAAALLTATYKKLRIEGQALARGGAALFDKAKMETQDAQGVGSLKQRFEAFDKLPKSLKGIRQELQELDFLIEAIDFDPEAKNQEIITKLLDRQNDALKRKAELMDVISGKVQKSAQQIGGSNIPGAPKSLGIPAYDKLAFGEQQTFYDLGLRAQEFIKQKQGLNIPPAYAIEQMMGPKGTSWMQAHLTPGGADLPFTQQQLDEYKTGAQIIAETAKAKLKTEKLDSAEKKKQKDLLNQQKKIIDEINRKKRKDRAFDKKQSKWSKSGLQSLGLGAGFPLLFGGGPGAIGGGILGGLVGEKVGLGQFGGQILFSALGQQLDKLGAHAIRLGEALRAPADNLDLFVKQAGLVGTTTGKLVDKLAAIGLKGEAANLVLSQFDTNELEELGKSFTAFQNTTSKLGLVVVKFVAGPLTMMMNTMTSAIDSQRNAGYLRQLRTSAYGRSDAEGQKFDTAFRAGTGMSWDQGISGTIGNQMTQNLAVQFDQSEEFLRKREAIVKAEEEYNKIIVGQKDIMQSKIELEQNLLHTTSAQNAVNQLGIDLQSKNLELKIMESNLMSGALSTAETAEVQRKKDLLELEIKLLKARKDNAKLKADPVQAAAINAQQSLDKLLDQGNQIVFIANTIGGAFREAFTGIMTGSMSAGEAISSMFKKVGAAFIDMAAQIMAQKMVLSIFSAFAGPLAGGLGGGITPTVHQAAGLPATGGTTGVTGNWMPSPGMGGWGNNAAGGYIDSPQLSMIAEGGQGEYVIPEREMSSALARYSQGARGEAVLAGGAPDDSVEGGVATATSPIDVRFTSERINSIDYVTFDQFQAGVTAAAEQGAKQGEMATLKRLKTSPSTRRGLGI